MKPASVCFKGGDNVMVLNGLVSSGSVLPATPCACSLTIGLSRDFILRIDAALLSSSAIFAKSRPLSARPVHATVPHFTATETQRYPRASPPLFPLPRFLTEGADLSSYGRRSLRCFLDGRVDGRENTASGRRHSGLLLLRGRKTGLGDTELLEPALL